MAQHLSIRIPWKDNGYDGRVCKRPCYNNACLRLKNIATGRDDTLEAELSGCPIAGHEGEIPCVSEGGVFLSADTHRKTTVHPYKKSNSDTHGHFLETELIYPPFSLPARPFAWTMLRVGEREKDDQNIRRLAYRYQIDYDPAREPELSFTTNWVQDATNQRAIFETFYQDVLPGKSLVIVYAKQVPFVDDAKRIVMGMGFVDTVTPPPEHAHTDEGSLRSILWETMIGHTIRDDRKNGFLLPYREMMEYAENHPEFDMRSVTVFAHDDYFEEFSYATEHLSYDAVINVLLQTLDALAVIKSCIPGNWQDCAAWVNERLREVWLDRGPFPGLGAMLCAAGFRFGIPIANQLKASLDGVSHQERLIEIVHNPKKYLTSAIVDSIGETERAAFCALPKVRCELFWLLARLSLTVEQADALFHPEKRRKMGMDCSDQDILENPYILYERSRMCPETGQISVRKVDMAVFPPEEIRCLAPLASPTGLESGNDRRRVRALAVDILESEAENGHTVYPQDLLIDQFSVLPIEPECHVSGDILQAIQGFVAEELRSIPCAGGAVAYQLSRLAEIDDLIRRSVEKRIGAKRHEVTEDWVKIVQTAFSDSELTDMERRAREEKAAILNELAQARLSVLLGGAGTGKTTLLSLLCKSPQIRDGGVLLLAPTGKARVRMSLAMQAQGIQLEAKTVAQFLVLCKRFDYATMRYCLSEVDAKDVPMTVIIDEASMLTEEMFGALLQALKKAQRIIFVGDPNQLPPIGAGRPFVDLVRHLRQGIPQFPQVGNCYGKLTVTRRQQDEDGKQRADTALAEWFSDTDAELDDEIFRRLQANQCGERLTFHMWKTAEELEALILDTLAREVGITDEKAFDLSLGGAIEGQWMNFGKQPQRVEGWQVLAPYRNDAEMGSSTINRYIHQKYRSKESFTGDSWSRRGTKYVLGTDSIVYGDKVINVRNHKRSGYPSVDCVNFVANGEVGIVERIWQKPKDKQNSHQVRFSSQPGFNYYWPSAVSDEGNCDLELAYALTVHKAQGSEFDTVILVLREPCVLLSKEMLYTAITRQKGRLVILYNTEAYHLRNYASQSCSDISRRFTSLFEAPNIVEYRKRFYEANLIHKTVRGELVRSKSEVIIANLLHDAGIDYDYERELSLGEDGIRIPDFTIDDAESGTIFYWEHCGMMGDAHYAKRWEAKKALYAKHGIEEGKKLIVTQDDFNGGIDSAVICALIQKYLL